jgi:hypothetical protein
MLGRLVLGTVAISFLSAAGYTEAAPSPATLPGGLPLRIAIDHRYSMKTGTRVEGHLTSPVYIVDRIVLPVDTPVYGIVSGRRPVQRNIRVNALMDGDFTPLAEPEVRFERMILPDGEELEFSAPATQRNAVVVKMSNRSDASNSISGIVKAEYDSERHEWIGGIATPGRKERLRQWIYHMLPYHPQDIWTGDQFDAELSESVEIPESQGVPQPLPRGDFIHGKPTGLIEAQLVQDLTSARCPVGMTVEAVLSRPLLDKRREHVLLPAGAVLRGSIVESQPAASFGRNGKLRFSFRKIDTGEDTTDVHGIMTGAESAAASDLEIDPEGGAHATAPNPALSTITLAVLAAASRGDDGGSPLNSAIVSNGFGMMGRIASVATANKDVASGFAYYALAKNVYRRYIAKGKDVTFPRNTRLQIELAER